MPRRNWLSFWAILLCVALATGPASAGTQGRPSPPGQPATGPGGRDYAYQDTRVTVYGEKAGAYTIAEPADPGDKALPVVLFVHGLSGTSYGSYEAWITHLVRKGNVVIYPVYHGEGVVDPKTFTGHAAKASAKAIKACDGKRHAAIDTERFTMVGHSLGGTIIANLAARPKHFGLPTPKAIMPVLPGDTRAEGGLGALLMSSITEDHSTIAKGTLILIVNVEDDNMVSPKVGQRIYDKTALVDAKDKRRLLLKTDDHGEPAIVADHLLPIGWIDRQEKHVRVNAYDTALWRWFDSLQAVADGDAGQRKNVFGKAALDLGKWSDGTEVRRPVDVSVDKEKP